VSVGEAIGWGTAGVAVVIAGSLAIASFMAWREHREQKRRIELIEKALFDAIHVLSIRSDGDPFQYLQSIMSHSDQFLPRGTTMELEERTVDLDELRRKIGSIATWRLRSVDPKWYPIAMAFVAAYDSGRQRAVS
jgi:hypothetical protein